MQDTAMRWTKKKEEKENRIYNLVKHVKQLLNNVLNARRSAKIVFLCYLLPVDTHGILHKDCMSYEFYCYFLGLFSHLSNKYLPNTKN